ncbi:epoxide hydrolase [Paraburkholderia phymatum]|uniref:epoxide hydrolase family protein n=1 Tax=Paraburkholderia phymatum TaxID=148447 RepID=UPI0031795867
MTPYKVEWSEANVAAMLERVRSTTLPPAPPGSAWTYGCDAAFLERVRSYWLDEYDWRAAQENLNRFPQFTTRLGECEIHFVHVRGESEGRRPLLLTHGWPGSHFEFWELIEPLAFPSRFGGRPESAFDLVIPSLPGFGFSGKPPGPIGQRATAALWNELMTTVLGYPQYLAQGGDWGSVVTSWLGLDCAASVRAIHLNMMAFRSHAPSQNEDEQRWMEATQLAQIRYGGYSALQMSKPQSLAWATADNPLGQAAWIIERFHDWSDLRRRTFEQVHPLDELLTNVMIYVMTGSFVSAAWYYAGVVQDGFCMLPPGVRCETPTAYASFSGDALMPPPPRSRFELLYRLTRWTDFSEGGHFAAMEQPRAFLDDLRTWASECWPLS